MAKPQAADPTPPAASSAAAMPPLPPGVQNVPSSATPPLAPPPALGNAPVPPGEGLMLGGFPVGTPGTEPGGDFRRPSWEETSRAYAGREREPEPPPARAKVQEGPEEVTCRPAEGYRLDQMGVCCIGNWVGRVGGKRVTVLHGTPLRGLPDGVEEAIRDTRGQRVGRIEPARPKVQGADVAAAFRR